MDWPAAGICLERIWAAGQTYMMRDKWCRFVAFLEFLPDSEKNNMIFQAGLTHIFRPEAGLYFSDMSAV